MYYVMRASAPSLHRESTDSLIHCVSWQTILFCLHCWISISDALHACKVARELFSQLPLFCALRIRSHFVHHRILDLRLRKIKMGLRVLFGTLCLIAVFSLCHCKSGAWSWENCGELETPDYMFKR